MKAISWELIASWCSQNFTVFLFCGCCCNGFVLEHVIFSQPQTMTRQIFSTCGTNFTMWLLTDMHQNKHVHFRWYHFYQDMNWIYAFLNNYFVMSQVSIFFPLAPLSFSPMQTMTGQILSISGTTFTMWILIDLHLMGRIQQATHSMWDYVRGRLLWQAAFTHSIENSVILDGSRYVCTSLMSYTHLYVTPSHSSQYTIVLLLVHDLSLYDQALRPATKWQPVLKNTLYISGNKMYKLWNVFSFHFCLHSFNTSSLIHVIFRISSHELKLQKHEFVYGGGP